ncbi:3-isopropylmalate dehydratase small subunit [Xanthobacter sp. KR7-225]|uniref:3-isopropylmalate dehydratase small subunit n=1 Tax=Xanthobacter sp. KR7-225 TaxID=3156613 RepID=UPI0032B30FAA
MEKFEKLIGIAAPLLQANIDTDIIIPSREITSPSREGFGEKAFASWRYLEEGRRENPDFILNQEPYRRSAILLTGANFGCGSSREMAVWALRQFGLRCLIAPSYGAIFADNCLHNGLLAVTLPAEHIDELATLAHTTPLTLEVDLLACEVRTEGGRTFAFKIGSREREMLLLGLDPIGWTFGRCEEIERFFTADRTLRPWIWWPGE